MPHPVYSSYCRERCQKERAMGVEMLSTASSDKTTTTTTIMTSARRRGDRERPRTRPTRRPKGRRRGQGRGSRRRGRRTTTTTTPTTTLITGNGGDDDEVDERILACTAAESRHMNCLNEGECFVHLSLGHIRTAGCRSDITARIGLCMTL